MTREEILRQMEALQAMLDEQGESDNMAYVNASLTEEEKEKQHQEDLQRITVD